LTITTADWPTASIVIPVRDGASALDSCLTAVTALDYPAPVQVIVVDNASTEDVGAVVARHPGVRLLNEPRAGSYAARNTGLLAATGEVLAFTDADCRPDRAWLRESVAALRRPPRADMVGGRVELTYREGRPVTGSEWFEWLHGFPQDRYLADQHFAVTASMVTWRSTMDRTGPFDARLLSRGDAEWGQRVAAWGGIQRYAPDAVVLHPARATLRESVAKWRRVARGRAVNDLGAGLGARHFAGLALHQVRSWLSTVVGVWQSSHLRGWGPRVRYLTTYSVCRAVTIREQLRCVAPALASRRATAGARS
jgi:glycosyltransferase involved in cell wall biosynthesis